MAYHLHFSKNITDQIQLTFMYPKALPSHKKTEIETPTVGATFTNPCNYNQLKNSKSAAHHSANLIEESKETLL